MLVLSSWELKLSTQLLLRRPALSQRGWKVRGHRRCLRTAALSPGSFQACPCEPHVPSRTRRRSLLGGLAVWRFGGLVGVVLGWASWAVAVAACLGGVCGLLWRFCRTCRRCWVADEAEASCTAESEDVVPSGGCGSVARCRSCVRHAGCDCLTAPCGRRKGLTGDLLAHATACALVVAHVKAVEAARSAKRE